MTMDPALKDLQKRLPQDRIQLDEVARYRASMDNLRLSRMPAAVITPADEDEVAVVLETANRHRQPLTVRGAGSATTGTTSPLPGGWVLDLANWQQLQVDPGSMMAYVQPGVTVQALDDAARAEGLFYPPDPGSKKFATIGGTLACNAGGLRGAKYGVTRDYVYALEGFLPTGEFVRWGGDVKKHVSGYNIRDLWIGSEGTLGVITGAVMKLLPAPEARSTALVAFRSEAHALELVREILEMRLLPSILEFLDRETVECFRLAHGRDPNLPPWLPPFLEGPVLLIELDGHPLATQEAFERLGELLRREQLAFKATGNDDEAELLWTIRRGCSKAMFQLGNTKLNEDIVVPLRHQSALLEAVDQLRKDTGLPCPTFGHAADGNFHAHIMYNREDAESCRRAEKGIQQLMEAVVEMGGVITGEHGVGLAKSPFLSLQHPEAEIGIMRRIKEVFDPNGILNADKIFTPFRVWEHPREEVQLPWDH